MFDKIISIFTTALAITAVGIALRPQSSTAAVIAATTSGFADIQKASFGPA